MLSTLEQLYNEIQIFPIIIYCNTKFFKLFSSEQLLELRGNIRVFCRCRYDKRTSCCLLFPSDHEVLPPGVKKGLKFDKVFTPESTQEEVSGLICLINISQMRLNIMFDLFHLILI